MANPSSTSAPLPVTFRRDADVMVITATHSHPVETAHTVIKDYSDLEVHIGSDGRLSIRRKQ